MIILREAKNPPRHVGREEKARRPAVACLRGLYPGVKSTSVITNIISITCTIHTTHLWQISQALTYYSTLTFVISFVYSM